MARDDKDEKDDADEAPRERRPSSFALWFEEAWEGWLKSVGLIVVLGGAFLLYKLTPETETSEAVFGAALVILLLVGILGAATVPAWSLARTPGTRALFVTFVAVWAVGVGYPSLRAAMPPRPLAELKLTPTAPSAKVTIEPRRSLELTVSGHFKRAGASEAEANYDIKVDDGHGAVDEVSGTLKRSLVRLRTSRRGGTSTQVQERTEQMHRLATVRGGELTLSSDGLDDTQLDEGLAIAVRPGGLDPRIFLGLGVLALLLAIGFDARLGDAKTKVKTYLSAAAGMTFVFALHYPEEATPHSVVRPAVGAVILALLIGGGGGWVLGAVARLLAGPKATARKSRR